MSAIFKRDLRAYFKSPLGYVYLAAFVLVLNIYFYLMNVYSGSSSLDGIFSFIVTMCVFLIPILTMVGSGLGSCLAGKYCSKALGTGCT